MNIFEQYGIKEVADVCLYSIELDENDDEVYIPVLYLDTLKVSTVEQTAEQVAARGGLGNPELIIWDYGKEITVNLEDALYTPASQGLVWGGKYGTKHFELYGNFTPKIYPENEHGVPDWTADPTNGTEEKAKIIIENFSNFELINGSSTTYKWKVNLKLLTSKQNTYRLEDCTINYDTKTKTWNFNDQFINFYVTHQKNKKVIGTFKLNPELNVSAPSAQEVIYMIDHALEQVEYLDRIEKCKATETFVINTNINTEHGNYRYLQQYSQSELTVFIDPKTMQPYEPNTTSFIRKNGETVEGALRLIKQHEIYYKWTRTKAVDYTSLGHQVIVDATHFPGTYRLVGETYSRSRKTGKDERFQFEIPLCKMGSENSFTLDAAGDPTTFNMSLRVLRREDGVMMKLTQYEVDKAKFDGHLSDSTNIIPKDGVMPIDPLGSE